MCYIYTSCLYYSLYYYYFSAEATFLWLRESFGCFSALFPKFALYDSFIVDEIETRTDRVCLTMKFLILDRKIVTCFEFCLISWFSSGGWEIFDWRGGGMFSLQDFMELSSSGRSKLRLLSKQSILQKISTFPKEIASFVRLEVLLPSILEPHSNVCEL